MITFILMRVGEKTDIIPWPDATPSARKEFRKTGQGITVVARDVSHVRACLTAYNFS